jgi:hypothetical protein
MRACFSSEPLSREADIRSTAAVEFRNSEGASFLADRPLTKAALTLLSRRWPGSLHVDDLLAASRGLAPAEAALDRGSKEDTAALCELLMRACAAGLVELHTWAPSFVAEISERPIASPVARYQSLRGKRMTTLWHTIFDLNDDLGHRLLELLDGKRDSAALAEALTALIERGQDGISHNGKPVTEPAEIRAMLAAGLPVILKRFATAAVLVG